ncbi:sterol O-acyltransferase 2 isoform X2 [Pieris brassicae]|uniref:sterol O-acyltransferase 2 isoform X2 n=1 Tax=Pieris brassicae TaxID=7116 RepID=UPI001E662221|nr:sterol O-acyltransferase 2 isoform X2 [Pieris brassicae]
MERVARRRNHENDNGYSKEKDKDPEFVHRESVLTVLMNESLHIKAIYHIFVAILIMLFLDTVIYDIVERGKLNVGIASVVYGFGDIKRAFKIWLFELTVALIFYPGLRIYATTRKLVKKSAASCQLLAVVGVICLILLQICLIGVPCWELGRKHLAVGSSVAVTCEMFRFAMKICAVAGDCIPRCHNDQRPLPPFQHYLYFLFAPTLIYRDSYPRTKKIRWGMVLFHFSEVAAVVFYNCFLWERFILPYWSDYGKKPQDWWTKSRYSNYYRAWNRVVSSWLRDYIFRPITPFAGRPLAYVTVFFVSSVAHEVILALGFGFFYPVLLIQFGVMGVMLLPLTATAGKRFPSIFNMFMWLSFFIGTGMLWSLYPMEYFARKNCPPSENDSFFIPKSWSCPKIVLKPNWTFENPFDLNIE